MKKLVLLILLVSVAPLAAQIGVYHNFNTGDSWFEISLNNLNYSAREDVPFFVMGLSTAYTIPAPQIEILITRDRLQPAEVFLIAEMAACSHRPFGDVVQVYRSHRHKGWGEIARRLGIKPGSREFKALKEKTDRHHGRLRDDRNRHRNNQQNKDRNQHQNRGKDQGHGQGKGRK
jgi:hypothetical protein